ncbi:ATP-dependent RNA helicase Ddx1 isoform X2 [Formica exsecta]|uniref:ATP-dependent RNA helicase Ddx1 isoform X1 n=1 Tax=Formica exsecta TaxID=72781 RepID=UPI0011436394|nr:ATP-dependent RNA helicase Ddx1 isoform X1 [Formica exsecta]XP_029673183.1 ATP-dependent RNA helicase Ddx1 isoform X2 [Formica exsecta]
MTAFEEMGVLPEIAKAVDELDWTLPTDVQAEAIPLILGGGDVLMAAETGSGKTGAFCLPILQIVWETLKDLESGKGAGAVAQAQQSTHWALSLFDRGRALAVTPDGLRCQSREQKEWHGCRANKGISGSGKYFFEAIVTDEGLCRVGWSTPQAALDLGTDRFGYGFGGTGKKSNAKQFDNYGEAFGMHDVIGCFLDLARGEIKFSKNGVDLGVAFALNAQQKSQTYYPAVVLKNAEMAFNFGAQPFKHPPPNDYVAVSSAPKESIKHNSVSSNQNQSKEGDKPTNNAPQAIIIEPSRELAEQTYNQIQKFKIHLKNPTIRELLVIGGVNVKEQIAILNSGVDIVVGTPGRLEDLIQGGYLLLTHCRFFVLDEADGLLKQGYTELIDRLHRQIPKITSDGKRLQMVVCSATLHAFEVKKMAERLMHFPTWVDLKGEDAVPETVHHVVVIVDPQKDKSWHNSRNHVETDGVHARDNVRPGNNTAETLSEAVKMLKGEYCIRAIKEHRMDRALIFCRTKLDCDNLERYLKQAGGQQFSCVCLHGDRKPAERKANLEKFKRQEVKFLICTDVAARGLDITGLPFMINITLPDEKSNYVHRIGRVGRAERMGLAISLVSSVPEKVWYHGEWCPSRGRNCQNTNLTNQGGCCTWYNEPNYLAEIEDHLNVTIQQVGSDIKVPLNDFDGKVTYGEKRMAMGSNYENHVQQMVPVVAELATLESRAQITFLKNHIAER